MDTGDMEIAAALDVFYRRWHLLEQKMGASGGSVIDFDFARPHARMWADRPYESRWEALQELEHLRHHVASTSWCNPSFLNEKLAGASAYLRALQGERLPFGEYVRATMGFIPVEVPEAEVATRRAELVEGLRREGFTFDAAGYSAYREVMGLKDLSRFEEELRREVIHWMGRLEELSSLRVEPRFRVEAVDLDAYWANWVDGGRDSGIRLRANIHPRIEYYQTSASTLAAHEIAGHAAQVLLCVDSPEVDASSLNVTVHSCEAYHMEGLAQIALQLLARPGEISQALLLREELAEYHQMVMNNAHMALERGEHLTDVVADVLRRCPFVSSLSARNGLRDRMNNPLFRSYLFVYGPSKTFFKRALKLGPVGLRWFLQQVYCSFQTPTQLEVTLKEAMARDGRGEGLL